MQYIANLHQATLNLQHNISSICDFPEEVILELNINSGTKVQRYVYDNYSVDTTEITMFDIDIKVDPLFSFLNISSIFSFALIRVGKFAEIASPMNECFDMLKSQIQI